MTGKGSLEVDYARNSGLLTKKECFLSFLSIERRGACLQMVWAMTLLLFQDTKYKSN